MSMNHPALFANVPSKDYFNFFNSGELDSAKVIEILNYKRQDVASATSTKVEYVRYDHKMPLELKERINEWAIALNLVAEFFKDKNKTILWFKMPNPLLGGLSPREMIKIGRFKKLFNFIQTALNENKQ